MRFVVLLLTILSVGRAFAQNGDHAGEEQLPPPAARLVPPAPVLSPAEALKTFKLQTGFRLELVASEPLIEAPVTMCFDPDGRLWVLEMRGFMPTPDAVGEQEPTGRVTILEDTDGDGRMDQRTVFLDGLVLPRALALVQGGALVAEPPHLWYCRDTDGDGKCDEKIEVAGDYATQADPRLGAKANPEHASNGLLWALDNWIYSANHPTRFRNGEGKWQRDSTVSRGQWGLTQDDYGRLFHNSNSDQLRADLVPAHYLARNPNLSGALGVNFAVARDQQVWPGRVNPGVNRGYQKGQLRDDGTLATYTGACGPCIYRGEMFPPEFRGAAFLCEPTGNLVRCNRLTESDGFIHATNAFPNAEFLTSTDERFRPVNLFNGPDGALYIVDMYRGLIQHRIYLTSYLRQQAESRGLEKGLDRGRIYRVVAEGARPGPSPRLSKAGTTELVAALAHPNGWWRDTAQRLLVERRDPASGSLLREVAAGTGPALARLHALWTLDGLGQTDAKTLMSVLEAPEPKLRAAAVRLSEPLLKTQTELATRLATLAAGERAVDVRLQLGFTLGEWRDPRAEPALAGLLKTSGEHALVREAVLSGLYGRELSLLDRLLADENWRAGQPGREAVVGALAACVFTEKKPARVNRLLELAVTHHDEPTQLTLLNAIASRAPAKGGSAARIRPVEMAAAPVALVALNQTASPRVRERVEVVGSLLSWPGKPGREPAVVVPPLNPAQQQRFDAGKALYAVTCGACHQPTGLGQEGLAPPLVDSEWALGPEQRLVRIVLQGVRGSLTVKGKRHELDMPSLAVFDDEQVAAVLTYLRREWGHTAAPVEPRTVAQIRAAVGNRAEAWTEAELLKIP